MKSTFCFLMAFVCHNAFSSGLLVSSIMANPKGPECSYEYLEFIATEEIDFSVTPYTIVFCNNGTILKPQGWMTGSTLTYAMELNSGIVKRGEVFYVGGDSKKLSGEDSEDISSLNWLKTVDYQNVGGDGGIGLKRVKNIGLIGNGGSSADGVAIFPLPANEITPASLPSDCVFYGEGIGESATFNYLLPDGSFLTDTSPFYKVSGKEGRIMKLKGVYDCLNHLWLRERTMGDLPLGAKEDVFTEIKLVPSVYDLEVASSCKPCLSWKSYSKSDSFLVFSSATSFEEIVGYVEDSLIGKPKRPLDAKFHGVVHSLAFCSEDLWRNSYWAVYDFFQGEIDTFSFFSEYNTLHVEERRSSDFVFPDSMRFVFDSGNDTIPYSDILLGESSNWKVDSIMDNSFDCSDLFKWTEKRFFLSDSCGNGKSFDVDVFIEAKEGFSLVDCPSDTFFYLASGETEKSLSEISPKILTECDSVYSELVITPMHNLPLGRHKVGFLLNYNGTAVDSCSLEIEIRMPEIIEADCPSDTIVWASDGSVVRYKVAYPTSSNSIVTRVGASDVVDLMVPDSLQLKFYMENEYGYLDSCAYWVYAKDSISNPTIECASDTTITISVLSADFTPRMAASPDGRVEALFPLGGVSGLQAGERMKLSFVAHDTLDGTHHSDTCFYWLNVVADPYTPTIECVPDTTITISVLSADFTPRMAASPDGRVEALFPPGGVSGLQAGERMKLSFVAHDTLDGTHHSDTCFYWLNVVADPYTPTIECVPDTTITISVLSADFTPRMAASPDGRVEALFPPGGVSGLQAGERMKLSFVAHDTLDGTHHSDTCFYWLNVVADPYTPTIECVPDTTITISVLSADFTPRMAASPDGRVEALFPPGGVSGLQAGERMKLSFVAHDTLDGTHHSDTCFYWLNVVADPYTPTIECVPDTTITLSVLSADFTPRMAASPDGRVEALFPPGGVSGLQAGERMKLSFVAHDTLDGTRHSDTCFYWLNVVADPYTPTIECASDTTITISVLSADFTPRMAASPDGRVEALFPLGGVSGLQAGERMKLSFVAHDTLDGTRHSDTCFYWLNVVADPYTPTIECASDTTITISVLSADFTPRMAASPDGRVKALFPLGGVSDLQAGERMKLSFVAHDTLDGTHHSDTCFYWLHVVADPMESYTPTIECMSDTTITLSVLSADFTPRMAASPDGRVEALFPLGGVSGLQAGERMKLSFVAHDTLDGTHHSDTCFYWLNVVADPYTPTIECASDTTITISVLSADFTPRMAASPDGRVKALFPPGGVSDLQAGERMKLSFVAHDTLDGTRHSDTCFYWLNVVADPIKKTKERLICPQDTIIYLSQDECEINYFVPLPKPSDEWMVILDEGLDGAMMRDGDIQHYSIVALSRGTWVGSCSYKVTVLDTVSAHFKQCSENLYFVASTDTSRLNIMMEFPLLDKTCRWDTISMSVSERSEGDILFESFSVKSEEPWTPLPFLPGDYSIYWQLSHRGTVVDECVSKVEIGVRSFLEREPKDNAIHNYLLSPNGDGKNDKLVIEEIPGGGSNEIVVYNQWGAVVFRMQNYDNSWDGTNCSDRSLQKGILPMGTYFYVLLSNGEKLFSGFIELLY